MTRRFHAAIIVLPMLALGGCVSFGAKAPPQLLTLSAAHSVSAGTATSNQGGPSITVLDPETPRKLDGVRVPVQVDATSIAYIKDAQWSDTPRHLFQKLLSETIASDGTTLVMQPGQYAINPGRRLMGQLIEFGVDAPTKKAIVTYDATLSDADGTHILRKRFSASIPLDKISAEKVAGPINSAANQVAEEVAEWVKKN